MNDTDERSDVPVETPEDVFRSLLDAYYEAESSRIGALQSSTFTLRVQLRTHLNADAEGWRVRYAAAQRRTAREHGR